MGYGFYNLVGYKIFLLATYKMVPYHCFIYGETLLGEEYWPPWTGVRGFAAGPSTDGRRTVLGPASDCDVRRTLVGFFHLSSSS
jgi:hypothetical protein